MMPASFSVALVMYFIIGITVLYLWDIYDWLVEKGVIA